VTDVAVDTRPIAVESRFYNATLVRREDLTDALAVFWVRFNEDPLSFEPGQYLTIGVESEGKLIQRPYSVASSPLDAADGYEYYVRLVEPGMFTPLLWRLQPGHPMSQKPPKGRFMLQPDDNRQHVFISSGTGIAPFISMMDTLRRQGMPRPAIVLHGVSHVADLGYRELLERWERSGDYPLRYVPSVSRPTAPQNAGWAGRTGRVESIVESVYDELGLTPDNTIAYVCGNPDMINAVDETLLARGFPEEQIRKELYWPKGKEPTRAGHEPVHNPD
jgi:ferredoxin--NADP+ reductase